MGVYVAVVVVVEVGLWGTDLLCTAGALTICLSNLGETGVPAGGEGLRGEVKRCGGQLGVLLGGTGGKEVSGGEEPRGLGSESTGALQRNLVLSLGTGLSLSPSIPPSPSSSFPPRGAVCLCPGIGFFSPPSPLSSFILGTCLSLGTGFSLSLGVGLTVSPSLFSRSLSTGFSSTGIGTGLSLCNTLACPVSSNL